ncbi:SPFH domain-containing protein, partial [Candidatus Gracilibacteria bacterium]|nr:SPFH domain-containing protein [Candidatus Gracilibacteria bacterium]
MEPKRKAAANVFLEQNLNQDDDAVLLSPAAPPPPPGVPAPARERVLSSAAMLARSPIAQTGLKTSEELQLEKEPIRVRETGFWPFKRVIVPPNVYVVHTRIGRTQPVTLGLGLSFRYNAATDAYLVVPAAMQTIGIVANSITREKQGINVLAYVQWQINDFGVAYRKLDFSDSRDPLGIVNAQLREQAEAAIKDKIATLSVEDVLTDKEPIIEELTTRLKAVAEGRSAASQDTDEGLGIKIVTVQIKEAVVSSQRLWEHLQAPFRYEQEKSARISFLQTQDEIREKELQTRQVTETSEAETLVEIERIKQSKQTEALEIRVAQEAHAVLPASKRWCANACRPKSRPRGSAKRPSNAYKASAPAWNKTCAWLRYVASRRKRSSRRGSTLMPAPARRPCRLSRRCASGPKRRASPSRSYKRGVSSWRVTRHCSRSRPSIRCWCKPTRITE